MLAADSRVCREDHARNDRRLRRAEQDDPELHQLMKSGVGIAPLKDFAEAAREELRTFSSL